MCILQKISVLKDEGKPTIYDLTFSTMTAGVNKSGGKWKNSLRIPETVTLMCNHGMIRLSGPAGNRLLSVSSFQF